MILMKLPMGNADSSTTCFVGSCLGLMLFLFSICLNCVPFLLLRLLKLPLRLTSPRALSASWMRSGVTLRSYFASSTSENDEDCQNSRCLCNLTFYLFSCWIFVVFLLVRSLVLPLKIWFASCGRTCTHRWIILKWVQSTECCKVGHVWVHHSRHLDSREIILGCHLGHGIPIWRFHEKFVNLLAQSHVTPTYWHLSSTPVETSFYQILSLLASSLSRKLQKARKASHQRYPFHFPSRLQKRTVNWFSNGEATQIKPKIDAASRKAGFEAIPGMRAFFNASSVIFFSFLSIFNCNLDLFKLSLNTAF